MTLSNDPLASVFQDDVHGVPVVLEDTSLLEALKSLDKGLTLDVRNPANLSRSLRLSHS